MRFVTTSTAVKESKVLLYPTGKDKKIKLLVLWTTVKAVNVEPCQIVTEKEVTYYRKTDDTYTEGDFLSHNILPGWPDQPYSALTKLRNKDSFRKL